MTIGTGIHLEPKTVALLLTLKAGGADPIDLELMSDDVVLMNAGHFPAEIDVDGLAVCPEVAALEPGDDGVVTLRLADMATFTDDFRGFRDGATVGFLGDIGRPEGVYP